MSGDCRRKESAEMGDIDDAARLAQCGGPFLPSRSEHDGDVVRIDTASLAELPRGAFG
jgi:hypothetical protein